MNRDAPVAGAAAAPVRWLLLDVGGVLEVVDDEVWPARFRSRWATRLGLSDAEFSQRLEEADLPDPTTRAGVAEEYWAGYGAAVGATSEVLAEMRADFWDEYCGTANTTLIGALQALHGSVGLAILSNSGDGAREEEERRFGFAALFEPICYSHELGVSKPDPRAFRLTLDQMHAAPEDVLFIDDHQPNIEAAQRLGLRTHLHMDDEGTLADIDAWVRGSASG
ncbi:HAD family hydrolase [uncultured Amnibacterium sp.]|uniref:HAD family hydrolase n=1 Tax=uncultured Amnibacterium sp. TaxID=1631851 RepID=UPI0035CAD311